LYNLSHLIYASTALRPFEACELGQILEESRVANARHDITGVLLHTPGNFFQVLEGEDTTLERLFERIQADERHTDVVRIIQEPIPRRAFGDWKMGYVEAGPPELLRIEGLEDFFAQRQPLSELGNERARKLLMAFTAGRWRGSLTGKC
jgi:hypothetical protein